MDYLSPYLQALTEGTQVVQQLRSAAQQADELNQHKQQFDTEMKLRQQEQNQNQQQRGFENQMQLSNAGAQPVNDSWRYAVPGSSAPWGDVAPGTVPVGPGDNLVSPPGGGKYRMPTQGEKDQAELGRKVSDAKAIEDAKQFNLTLPSGLGDILGLPHGSTVTVQHAPTAEDYSRMGEAVTKSNAPEKTAPHVVTSTNDTGDVTTTAFDPATGEQKWTKTQKGAGAKRTDPDQPKKATPGEISLVLRSKNQALSKSAEDLQKALSAADKEAAAAKNKGEDFDHAGAIRQAYIEHANALKKAQTDYEDGLSQLHGHDVGHNDWADKEYQSVLAANPEGGSAAQPQTQQQPPGKAGAGGQGPGAAQAASPERGRAAQAKTASMTQVNAYAQKYGLSKAAAIKAFQSDGIKVGQ